jgi:hypothetical protein
MLYFIIVWLILLISCLSVGNLALIKLTGKSFQRLGDRFFLAIWLGLLIYGISLLTLSLFIPLSFKVGILLIVSLSLLSWTYPQNQREMIQYLRYGLKRRFSAGFFFLLISLALMTTHPVKWGESAAYHYTAIRWLSEHGSVTGVALIKKNLGITSSWFALQAPFNGSIINFRAGALINVFVILITTLHFLISLGYWQGEGRANDKFAISFFLVFLIYLTISWEMRSIVISASPDLPIIFLSEFIAWLMLTLNDDKIIVNSASKNIYLLPLVIATGAVSIKLTALPLLFITTLYFILANFMRPKNIIIAILICFLILLPMLSVGVKTSGCPLYPSSLFCFDFPWSQTRESVEQFAAKTDSLTEWFGEPPSGEIAVFWLFKKWLFARWLNQVMAFLGVVGFVSSLLVLLNIRHWKKSGIFWVLLLGNVGSVFIFLKGPLIRFGIGYLLLLPALLISIYFPDRKIKKYINSLSSQLSISFSVAIITLLLANVFYSPIQSRWILPGKIPNPSVEKRQINDLVYFSPLKGPCWAAPIPCRSGENPLSKIKLKNPSKGIEGGIIKLL